MENHGHESEAILHHLTSIRFLSDFVFPNPPYFKGTLKRELADMLVMVGDTLILFQVKAHKSKPESPHDISRVRRKIEEAYRQFRSIVDGQSSLQNTTLPNRKGVEVPFNIRSFKTIFLICVIDFIQETDSSPVHFRTVGYNEHDYPVFTFGFEAKDLFFLLHQLDTIPDFTAHLTILAFLEKEAPISLELSHLDLLAFTRLYPGEIEDLLKNSKAPPHLAHGIGAELVSRAKDFELEESYLIDGIIDYLHTSIGAPHPDAHEATKFKDSDVNSVNGYWKIASRLASLRRTERESLAKFIQRKHVLAEANQHSYGAIVFKTDAILIHVSSSSRTSRIKELGGFCLVLLEQQVSIEAIYGLGFSVDITETGLVDALYIERSSVANLPEVGNLARPLNLFSDPAEISRSFFNGP